jgi:hypothetical protein
VADRELQILDRRAVFADQDRAFDLGRQIRPEQAPWIDIGLVRSANDEMTGTEV